LPNLRLILHPSVSLLKSRFPIVSVWEANVLGQDDAVSLWREESALVARPRQDVEVWRLPAGGYEFFSAIAEGEMLGAAIAQAMAKAPAFDLGAAFNLMLSADVVVELEADTDPPILSA
jgi:hypothetical protein